MKPKLLIFLSFVLISLGLTGYSFYRSTMARLTGTEAAGFGLSSPYFQADGLKPGESYGSSVTLLRSADDVDQRVRVRVDAPGFEDWLNIKTGDEFVIAKGELRENVMLSARVPAYAVPGNYRGRLAFYTVRADDGAGVKVSLGAIAPIDLTVVSPESAFLSDYRVADDNLYSRLKGSFITVADIASRLYYADPDKPVITEIASATAAMLFTGEHAVGLADQDLVKIPVGLDYLNGADSDRDGLPDNFETAVRTDSSNIDSDHDGFGDLMEFQNGYDPGVANGALPIDLAFTRERAGRIFLATENQGQAWYVNPLNYRRYYLPDNGSAWFIFLQLAKRITASDFARLIAD